MPRRISLVVSGCVLGDPQNNPGKFRTYGLAGIFVREGVEWTDRPHEKHGVSQPQRLSYCPSLRSLPPFQKLGVFAPGVGGRPVLAAALEAINALLARPSVRRAGFG